MKTLPRLGVEPLTRNLYEIAAASSVTPQSELFRPDTRLSDVLDIALQRTDPDKRFQVVSAGCSFGAEIDSILATVQYNSPRPTAVLGVDSNPRAIKAAKTGQYQMTQGLMGYRRSYAKAGLDFHETMEQIHFKFSPDEHNPGLHTLDTNSLRQQHQIEVMEGDLADRLPTNDLAQVVMCNNVLFHLSPNTAEGIANNLAQHVALEGILSFGANPAQKGMEANKGMDYLTWLQQMGTQLEQQGMEPVLYSQDVAFAFQRTAEVSQQ